LSTTTFIDGGGASTGVVHWRSAERHFATIVVKSEVTFVGVTPNPCRASAVRAADGWNEVRGPRGERVPFIEDATDLVPYLGRAEVLFFGGLYGGPLREAEGRLSVYSRPATGAPACLVDKRVIGPIASRGVRLDYRLSRFSERFNPVGRADPEVHHALAPAFPGAMGPLSPSWPCRRELLRPEDFAALAEHPPHVAGGFPFAYFHSAPTDQRANGYFEGTETIVLEGLTRVAPQVELALPALRAHAIRVLPSGANEPLALLADCMRVYGDELRVSLAWRAVVPLERASEALVVAAAVTDGGRAVDWSRFVPQAPTPAAASRRGTGTADLPAAPRPKPEVDDEQTAVDDSAVESRTLPFLHFDSTESRAPVGPAAPVPGAPWSVPLPSVPGAGSSLRETALSSVNLADLAQEAIARRAAAAVARPPAPTFQPVSQAPRSAAPKLDPVGYVKLRDTPGSRYIALVLAELRRRDRPVP
jgi:hypothetical protein